MALGLQVEGRTFVEGEFLDTVIGIPDSRTEIRYSNEVAGSPMVPTAQVSGPQQD